jgi:ABC-type lipoprotein release transport system permease subunit
MAGPKLRAMAWRNLGRQKRRTALTMASIAFGIVLAVLFTALQDYSFAQMIDTAARIGTGHVVLQNPAYLNTPNLTLTIDHSDHLAALALADPEVVRAVPRISGEAMVSSARDSFSAAFIAYDPNREDSDTLSALDALVEGDLFHTTHDPGIILGRTLAHNLRLEMGDRVVYRLTDRQGDVTAGLGRLTGLLETGTPSVDAGLVLLPIDSVRQVLGYGPDECTQVALFISDARHAEAVAERLRPAVGRGVAVLVWDQVRPELSGFIALKVGGARFMEMVILLIVAASIFNTLFVSVMERSRELGIMMAIGYGPGQIFRLIMWESLWLALLGLAAGAAVSIGPYVYLSGRGIDLSSVLGQGTEVAGVGFDPTLRVGIFPEHAAWIGAAVLLATLLAGLYPAWRAARQHPVDSIRLV